MSFDVFPEPSSGLVPIDLDVWLETLACKLNQKEYTYNDLVRAHADVTGSHFDKDADPLADQVELVALHGENVNVPVYVCFATLLGESVLRLAERVIDASPPCR